VLGRAVLRLAKPLPQRRPSEAKLFRQSEPTKVNRQQALKC
jgi:hypothetical protein